MAERRRDQGGEERVARQGRLAVRRQRAEHVRADEVLDRVVAQEGGEQDRDRRQLPDGVRGARRDAIGLEARRQRVRQRRGEAEDHQREEDADRQDLRGVLERLVHRAARSAVLGRQAVHHGGAVGRREQPHGRPDQQEDRAEGGVGEVRRQQHQQPEADRREDHAGGRERARAEAVRQVARRRADDQHPDRERQHVDAGPQRRLGEVVAVLGQPDALQPDDEHEHQAAARDRRQERRQRAERERPDAEQRQAEHRVLGAPLDAHEDRQARDGARQQHQHARAAPARRLLRPPAGCRR